MVEQGRADEEAVLMPLEREAATVDDEFGALVGACLNPGFDLCLVRGGDDGAVMRLGIGRHADAQRLDRRDQLVAQAVRSEEHTSELQSLMRSSYAVFCLKKKKKKTQTK